MGAVGAIVQARMSSRRLPGKALREIEGKPLLGYLLDAMDHCPGVARTVVATSTDPSDDTLADFCRRRGVGCFRGALDDVAGRFLGAADEFGFPAFARLNGDSPLLDTRLVDRAVSLFQEKGAGLATNVRRRTFPKGQSVEVLSAEVFRKAYSKMTDAQEREHVTPHFYRNPGDYRIVSFESGGDFGGVQLSVDTPGDFGLIEGLVKRMDRPHWEYGWQELLALRQGLLQKEARP